MEITGRELKKYKGISRNTLIMICEDSNKSYPRQHALIMELGKRVEAKLKNQGVDGYRDAINEYQFKNNSEEYKADLEAFIKFQEYKNASE